MTEVMVFLCIPVLFASFVFVNEAGPRTIFFQILFSLIPSTIVAVLILMIVYFFFSSRSRHTSSLRDWSSDVCSSDLGDQEAGAAHARPVFGSAAGLVA